MSDQLLTFDQLRELTPEIISVVQDFMNAVFESASPNRPQKLPLLQFKATAEITSNGRDLPTYKIAEIDPASLTDRALTRGDMKFFANNIRIEFGDAEKEF